MQTKNTQYDSNTRMFLTCGPRHRLKCGKGSKVSAYYYNETGIFIYSRKQDTFIDWSKEATRVDHVIIAGRRPFFTLSIRLWCGVPNIPS